MERAKGNNSSWSELATPSETNYGDSGAEPGVLYWYRVRACNNYGECSNYAPIDSGYKALEAPSLKRSIKSDNELKWNPVINATFYHLYQAVDIYYYPEYEEKKFKFKSIQIGLTYDLDDWEARKHPAVAIQACNSLTCSQITVWNLTKPSIQGIIGLLLQRGLDSL